jgi:hypothetical protein
MTPATAVSLASNAHPSNKITNAMNCARFTFCSAAHCPAFTAATAVSADSATAHASLLAIEQT